MSDSNSVPTLGDKIRYFRQRAGLSQLKLELAIGAAQGSISRMESGTINPTKETISKIAHRLSLTDREMDYLVGVRSVPASSQEIEEAKAEIHDHFEHKDVFAYLLDDRYRFLAISRGFRRLFGIFLPNIDAVCTAATSTTLTSIMLNSDFQICRFLDWKTPQGEALLRLQLARFKREVSFMLDPLAKQQVDTILSHPIASKIWHELQKETKGVNVNSLDAQVVIFYFKGLKIKLNYIREPLGKHSRFETIEYIPTNALVKLMAKL